MIDSVIKKLLHTAAFLKYAKLVQQKSIVTIFIKYCLNVLTINLLFLIFKRKFIVDIVLKSIFMF